MIKVVLDTNILVSAFLFKGVPGEVFDLAADGKIQLIISPAILGELSQVFSRKFKMNQSFVKKQIKTISGTGKIIVPKIKINVLKYDPDNKILEVALAGKADFIITGDKKHLLPLKNFRHISIITPQEFMEVFGSQGKA